MTNSSLPRVFVLDHKVFYSTIKVFEYTYNKTGLKHYNLEAINNAFNLNCPEYFLNNLDVTILENVICNFVGYIHYCSYHKSFELLNGIVQNSLSYNFDSSFSCISDIKQSLIYCFGANSIPDEHSLETMCSKLLKSSFDAIYNYYKEEVSILAIEMFEYFINHFNFNAGDAYRFFIWNNNIGMVRANHSLPQALQV